MGTPPGDDPNPDTPPRPSARPSASILLVNWNTRELLGRCLDALAAAEDRATLDVVVVDNGSTDDSAALLHDRAAGAHGFARLHVIVNAANVGFTAATNQACTATLAPVVVMLNSDTRIDPGAVRNATEFLRDHTDVGAVGGAITFPDGRPQSSCFRFPSLGATVLAQTWLPRFFPRSPTWNYERYGERVFDTPTDVDCCMGSFLAIARERLPAAQAADGDPLLDPGFWMYGEEADLCRRLRAADLRVVYLPAARLVHEHMGSVRSDKARAWKYATVRRAHLRFIAKWQGDLAAWLANLAMLIGVLPRVLAWFVADAKDVLTGRGLRPRKLKMAGSALALHARVLLWPPAARSQWGPPG